MTHAPVAVQLETKSRRMRQLISYSNERVHVISSPAARLPLKIAEKQLHTHAIFSSYYVYSCYVSGLQNMIKSSMNLRQTTSIQGARVRRLSFTPDMIKKTIDMRGYTFWFIFHQRSMTSALPDAYMKFKGASRHASCNVIASLLYVVRERVMVAFFLKTLFTQRDVKRQPATSMQCSPHARTTFRRCSPYMNR